MADWRERPPLAVTITTVGRYFGVIQPAPHQRASANGRSQADNRQALLDLLGGQGFAQEKPEWLKKMST